MIGGTVIKEFSIDPITGDLLYKGKNMKDKNTPPIYSLKPHFSDFDSSFLDDNFFNINKEEFLYYKSLEQRLSSGFIRYEGIRDEKDFLAKAATFFARITYTLFEFITNEKQGPVHLNPKSDASFCGLTKNIIQIGLNILTQDNIGMQHKVDIVASTILHEQYHKRFTIADIKKGMLKRRELGFYDKDNYYSNPKTKVAIEKLLPTKLHGFVNNILEDRRIEYLGGEDFPGFSFFFEESRKYAAFLHEKKKFNPNFLEGAIVDYILIKVLLPEMEETFMKEIDRFEKVMSADSSLWPSEKEKLDEVKEVISILKTHIEKNEATVISSDWEDIVTETANITALIPKPMADKINKQLEKMMEVCLVAEFGVENENEGNRRELTEEETQLINEAIAEELSRIKKEAKDNKRDNREREVKEHKVKSKNKNEAYTIIQMIEEPIEKIDTDLLSKAKAASKNIFANLGFLDSKFNRVIENYELTEGDLDETELFSIGFGNKNLFEEIEDIPGYSLDFALLLDESGSMGSRIKEAKLAVLALLLGLKDNSHINLFVYGHTADEARYDGAADSDKKIQMFKYYNTLHRFLKWERMFSARSRSNNADGYAIQEMGEIMKESKSKDKILCVVSDGQPAAHNYGGNEGEIHVKQVVDELEAQGILVVQICMNFIENSPRMFKHFVPYEEDGKFFDNLKKILLTKLNQFSDMV